MGLDGATNVLPVPAVDDVCYASAAYAELGGQGRRGVSSGEPDSDVEHLRFS